jgi:hypothetical protein
MTYFDRGMLKDSFMADELESLPGNRFIYLGEAKKFFNGENFSFIGDEGKNVEVEVDSDTYIAFDFYYNVWDDFNQFKILPHGRGTMHENPWVLDIIKYFNYVNKEIELHREQKRR